MVTRSRRGAIDGMGEIKADAGSAGVQPSANGNLNAPVFVGCRHPQKQGECANRKNMRMATRDGCALGSPRGSCRFNLRLD